jgi:hypothetical protein
MLQGFELLGSFEGFLGIAERLMPLFKAAVVDRRCPTVAVCQDLQYCCGCARNGVATGIGSIGEVDLVQLRLCYLDDTAAAIVRSVSSTFGGSSGTKTTFFDLVRAIARLDLSNASSMKSPRACCEASLGAPVHFVSYGWATMCSLLYASVGAI